MSNENMLELLFSLKTTSDNGLEKAEQAIKKIASESGLTGAALANLERNVRQQFEQMAAAGLSFQQIINRLAKSGDEIGRGVAGSAKQIEKSLKDAADAASNLEKKQKDLQNSASGIKSAISNPLQAVESAATSAAASLGPVGLAIIGVSVAATLGAKELFDFVDAQGKAAQQTVNMATRLGLTAGQMKALEVEAKIAGVSTASFSMTARYLSQALEDSTGSGKRSASALKELGVSMQTASGQAREEGAVFLETVDALSKVESQTKRTQLSIEAFGRGGYRDIQNLVAAYGDLKTSAQELGATDTTQLLEQLKSGEEQINKMSSAWDIFKLRLGEKIAPVVIPIVQQITRIIVDKNSPNIHARGTGEGGILDESAITGQGDDRLSATDVRGRGFQGDAAGLRLSSQINVADLAGGKSLTDRFEANRKNTPEGRAASLEEISKKLKDIADKFAKGGLGDAAAQILDTQRKQLESEKVQLQNANSAYSKRESLLRELTGDASFDKRHPSMAGDLESESQLRKLAAERQRDLDVVGKGNESLVDAKYGPKIEQAIEKLFESIRRGIAKGLESTEKEQGRGVSTKLDMEEFSKHLRELVELSKIQYDEAAKRVKIYDTSDRSEAQQRSSHAIQMAQLSSGEGGRADFDAIQRGTASRVGSADQLRRDALKEISDLEASINENATKTLDDEKQLEQLTTRRLEVEAQYREEIDKAHMDAELKIGEIQQKQLESYKQEAESLFDALRKGGNAPQHWFQGQANDLLKGIFGNVTAPIFQKAGEALGSAIPGQTNPDGSKTAIGNIFKGTILDSSHAASPEIKSRDLNTTAIDRLTATLSGSSVGGQSATVASGSPADALSQFVSGSANVTPGSPAAALTQLASSGGNVTDGSPAQALTKLAGVGASDATGSGRDILSLLLGSGAIAGGTFLSSIGKGEAAAEGSAATGSGGTVVTAVDKLTKAISPTQTGQTAALPTGLGGFTSGFTQGAASPSDAYGIVMYGGTPVYDPKTDTFTPGYSTSQRVGAGVGAAATVGLGAYETYNDFSRGGLKNDLAGVGTAAGVGALIDPEPVSKAVLATVSATASLMSAILPDPKTIRAAQIQNQTQFDQYLAPPKLDRNLDSGGDETYLNKYGKIQTTQFNAVQIAQPYLYKSPINNSNATQGGLLENFEVQPGQVLEPYQSGIANPGFATKYAPSADKFTSTGATTSLGGSFLEPYSAPVRATGSGGSSNTGDTIHLTIHALDAQSILDRSSDLASAVQKEVRLGHPVGRQIQQAVLGT